MANASQRGNVRVLSLMTRLGLLHAGFITVDRLTDTMLPITARHFTSNIAVIGLLLAFHRVCGCFVQPYAAWKSDRHRSPAGRRRPFFLGALPPLLAAVCLLGALPRLAHGRLAVAIGALLALVVLDIAMQAGQAVGLGCVDPLYGDTFGQAELGRASGVRHCCQNIAGFGMAFVAMPLADSNEFYPYAWTALFLVIAWAATVGLREPMPRPAPPDERYDPLRPLVELKDPYYAGIAFLATACLVSGALINMLHCLYVTESLHLSKGILGRSNALGIVVALACSYPIGAAIDRWGPRRVQGAGFVLLGITALLLAYAVHGALGVYLVAIPWALGTDCVNLPVIPMLYGGAPADRRGSIFGAVQSVRALVTFVALLLGGELAQWSGSYRVCYVAGACACAAGFAGLVLLPTRRTAGTASPAATIFGRSRSQVGRA
jgi:MFS family permease